MNWIKKSWNGIEVKPKTVREFGFILTGFFLFAPLLANAFRVFIAHKEFHYWPGWVAFGISALAINIFFPPLMTLIFHAAMFAAQGISWVMMRIILGIMFYFVLSPMSVIMRLLGKDILDQKIDPAALSYWKKHVTRPGAERYERLF